MPDRDGRMTPLELELLNALECLVPKDLDEHPQDFAPEWHRAAILVKQAQRLRDGSTTP